MCIAYYVCVNAHQRGWNQCAARLVSAASLEETVIQQLQGIAQGPQMLAELVRRVQQQGMETTAALRRERSQLTGELGG